MLTFLSSICTSFLNTGHTTIVTYQGILLWYLVLPYTRNIILINKNNNSCTASTDRALKGTGFCTVIHDISLVIQSTKNTGEITKRSITFVKLDVNSSWIINLQLVINHSFHYSKNLNKVNSITKLCLNDSQNYSLWVNMSNTNQVFFLLIPRKERFNTVFAYNYVGG